MIDAIWPSLICISLCDQRLKEFFFSWWICWKENSSYKVSSESHSTTFPIIWRHTSCISSFGSNIWQDVIKYFLLSLQNNSLKLMWGDICQSYDFGTTICWSLSIGAFINFHVIYQCTFNLSQHIYLLNLSEHIHP